MGARLQKEAGRVHPVYEATVGLHRSRIFPVPTPGIHPRRVLRYLVSAGALRAAGLRGLHDAAGAPDPGRGRGGRDEERADPDDGSADRSEVRRGVSRKVRQIRIHDR